MKLLALDIDGVLNTYEGHLVRHDALKRDGCLPPSILEYDRHDWVETEKLGLLHQVANHPEVTIVGVSSWFGRGQRRPETVAKFLQIDIPYVVDATGGGQTRVDSLRRFIDANPITHLAVLDDQPDWGEFHASHVRPIRHGLEQHHIDTIKRLLEI